MHFLCWPENLSTPLLLYTADSCWCMSLCQSLWADRVRYWGSVTKAKWRELIWQLSWVPQILHVCLGQRWALLNYWQFLCLYHEWIEEVVCELWCLGCLWEWKHWGAGLLAVGCLWIWSPVLPYIPFSQESFLQTQSRRALVIPGDLMWTSA